MERSRTWARDSPSGATTPRTPSRLVVWPNGYPTGPRLDTCRTAARLGQASDSGEGVRGTPPESRTPSSTPALVMTWGSGVAVGGASRRDRASSKARARAMATTVFGDIGLPGWRTRCSSVSGGEDPDSSTSPASRSMSCSDSS
ncbi:unnamed protein product [Phytophthora fragariaefolia]|uniref:Unnamed protein product n=1 Tax=Phytophthora fragariaefolia TaxID=1490495 RepID=A0A9W6YB10_9STRA|nr:unnamed protein product [Phytophthora fragariaefolia]